MCELHEISQYSYLRWGGAKHWLITFLCQGAVSDILVIVGMMPCKRPMLWMMKYLLWSFSLCITFSHYMHLIMILRKLNSIGCQYPNKLPWIALLLFFYFGFLGFFKLIFCIPKYFVLWGTFIFILDYNARKSIRLSPQYHFIFIII